MTAQKPVTSSWGLSSVLEGCVASDAGLRLPGSERASSAYQDDSSRRTEIAALSRHLFGRYEPSKLLVIIRGYFDAAGVTDRNCPVVTMGGYVAPIEKWAALENELDVLFAEHHIEIFHAVDLRQSKGEFSNTAYWTRARKKFFNNSMLELTKKHLAFGCVASMTKADYQAFYADANVKKMQRDTTYAIVFQACVYVSLHQTIQRNYEDPELSFFLESGDQNCGDAVRVYEIVKKDIKAPYQNILSPAISFVSKEECRVMSVADSITYGRKRVAYTHIMPPYDSVWTEEDSAKGDIPIYDCVVTKESLEAHKNELLEDEAKRMGFGKQVPTS